MYTRTRRPQGFQVKKRKVQDPMSYFAQNGLRTDVPQEDPPEGSNWILRAVKGAKDLFGVEDEPQGYQGLSFPKPAYTPEEPMVNLFKEGTDAYKKREDEIRRARYKSAKLSQEDMENVMSLSDPDGTEFTGRAGATSSVTPIKEPTNQPQSTQGSQGGHYMPNQAERKKIQMFYESSGNPNAQSKYAGGLYGVSPAALTDAVKDGIVPEDSNVYDPEVNEKVRDYYMTKSYNAEWVKNATNNLSRLMRSYQAYNQGGLNALNSNEAAKKDGQNINPTNYEEAIALLDATGPSGKYDGGHYWPKETRDYVKGIVLGDVDSERVSKDFKLGQREYGGRMASEGTDTGDDSPTIEELSLAKRLREVTGKDTSGFVRLAGDVDFSKLSNLSDEQLGALYAMAEKYSQMFPKGGGKGASGVVSRLKENYPALKQDLDKTAEITGLSRGDLKDIGYDIIDANPGDKMGYLTRGAAKGLLYSLKRGGRLGNI